MLRLPAALLLASSAAAMAAGPHSRRALHERKKAQEEQASDAPSAAEVVQEQSPSLPWSLPLRIAATNGGAPYQCDCPPSVCTWDWAACARPNAGQVAFLRRIEASTDPSMRDYYSKVYGVSGEQSLLVDASKLGFLWFFY